MNSAGLKSKALAFLGRWWCSLLLVPFMIYSLHQIYWTLNYNIFFAVHYDYPLPLNIFCFFVDNFLLIVHEAGHTFLVIFGFRILTIAAGSIFQIFLPLLIVYYCWGNQKKAGAQFALCLTGYSFIDVAIYAGDAGAPQLPLIGGLGKEAHDWHNLLRSAGLLSYDTAIALGFVILAITFYLGALLLPLRKTYKEISIDLNIG